MAEASIIEVLRVRHQGMPVYDSIDPTRANFLSRPALQRDVKKSAISISPGLQMRYSVRSMLALDTLKRFR